MKRALLPSILAIFALVLIMWASTMPLFEWETSFITSDYPPDYKIHLVSSPWITQLGQSLEDPYFMSHKIVLSVDQYDCWIDSGQNIERSTTDRWLDVISSKFKNVFLWSALGTLILIILSGVYLWWMIIWREHRTIADAIAFSIIVLVLFAIPVGMRLLGPRISLDYSFMSCFNNYNTVSFRAEISKVHYETLIIAITAVLAEVGVLGIMLYEIVRAVKESSKSAVG